MLTHCGLCLFVQCRQQNLYSSRIVVHSFLACVDLPQVHVLSVAYIWAQLHSTQKNLERIGQGSYNPQYGIITAVAHNKKEES